MTRLLRQQWLRAGSALLLAAVSAPDAEADELRFSLTGGRVTLEATDARLVDILAAWSAAGDTEFIGAEELAGKVVTLRLVDAYEAEALGALLRPAAGYIASRRAGVPEGLSSYDRVRILGADAQSPQPSPEAANGAIVPADRRAAAPEPDLQREHLAALLAQSAGGAVPPADGNAAGAAPDTTAPTPATVTSRPGLAGAPPRPPRWDRRRQPGGDPLTVPSATPDR